MHDNKSIFSGALKGDIYRKVKSMADMLVLISPLQKSIAQVYLQREIEQYCNVFLSSVSFQDTKDLSH